MKNIKEWKINEAVTGTFSHIKERFTLSGRSMFVAVVGGEEIATNDIMARELKGLEGMNVTILLEKVKTTGRSRLKRIFTVIAI